MKKKYNTPPIAQIVEVEGEAMVAESFGLNDAVGNKNQLVKGVELPEGPKGKDVVNRSLWDDEW